jgi:general secretion pathway protein E
MILTTGPTGSGKTTSLYAMLRYIHTPEIKIVTLEDPIEYRLEGIIQTQVTKDYTFAGGLRSILRQDPDVILVGEIRDRDVAETAVHAAQTGHLVFSTLHTNSAAAAFARLIDLGVDPKMIESSVNLVLSERLVRTLCPECKEGHAPTQEERAQLETMFGPTPHDPIDSETLIYDARSCTACNGTGFQGRIGIFEGIRVDQAVSDIVLSDTREATIRKTAAPQGIPTMAADGALKILSGTTSLAEVLRVVDLADIEENVA